MFSPSIEYALLLCCARKGGSEAEDSHIVEIARSNKLDWQCFYSLAAWHKILPLVYNKLQSIDKDLVPPQVFSQLHTFAVANTVRNLSFCKELIKIIYLFKSNSIDAIPFKGPTLSLYLYGDIALRSFGDLDILIAEEDVLLALSLLETLGYIATPTLTEMQFKVVQRSEYQISATNKDSIVVELHWRLTDRSLSRALSIDNITTRESVKLAGEKICCLPRELLFVYLCIHGSHHCWYQLEAVCCLVELSDPKKKMDWLLVLELANDHGCVKVVLTGLLLCRDFFGVELPNEVVAKKYKMVQSVEVTLGGLKSRILRSANDIDLEPASTRSYLFHVQASDRIFDKVSYVLSLLFLPTFRDLEVLPLPSWCSFLYAMLRPLRLCVETIQRKIRGGKGLKDVWS